MALDAQSNWEAEVSKLGETSMRSCKKEQSIYKLILQPSKSTREVPLPVEVLNHIVSYLPQKRSTQVTIWACTLVSRSWYSANIGFLYERPYLNSGNFNQFLATICPSKNAHIILTPLSGLVRRLDMGELAHDASRSLMARLLGRLKGNLEEFVAPQVSFAINSFAALSKCTKLRYLDLSLISASISRKLLFQTLNSLQDLDTLLFPRSSSNDEINQSEPSKWPPRLQTLHLAGGVDNSFSCKFLIHVPQTLSNLSMQHCPQLSETAILLILSKLGLQLKKLTIRHPMPKLEINVLDSVLQICPSLKVFCTSADFVSNELFSKVPVGHPLRILDLDCSHTAEPGVDISANAILCAVNGEILPDLRCVRVSAKLGWNATPKKRSDAEDLSDI